MEITINLYPVFICILTLFGLASIFSIINNLIMTSFICKRCRKYRQLRLQLIDKFRQNNK